MFQDTSSYDQSVSTTNSTLMEDGQVVPSRGQSALNRRGQRHVPRWDSKNQTLWLGKVRLKAFRKWAPDQVAVLAAFQGQQAPWQERIIDDPVPPKPGENSKDRRQRLARIRKNLNHGLPDGTIRFRTFDKGRRIGWEYALNRERK